MANLRNADDGEAPDFMAALNGEDCEHMTIEVEVPDEEYTTKEDSSDEEANMWNADDGEAPDFMAALYGEDCEHLKIEVEVPDEEYTTKEDSSDEEDDPVNRVSLSPTDPLCFPVTSPDLIRRHRPRAAIPHTISSDLYTDGDHRSRSRSPLSPRSVVVTTYDEEGSLEDEFYTPDSHALYDSDDSMDESMSPKPVALIIGPRALDKTDDHSRARNVRGRAGSVRVPPTRGGIRRFRNLPSKWQPGQPLEEVWLTDDDVPPEVREMARDVLKRRQVRVELEAQRRTGMNDGDSSERENEDVFENTTGGTGHPLLEGEDLHFEWSPMETFRGVEETFTPERTGSVASYTNPYDAFRSYWDDSILKGIADATNQYASRVKSVSFQSDWYPTNVHELLCLFAFWMMTGIIRMPTINSYFSNNALLKTDVFSRITTLKRYTILTRALHFETSPSSDSAQPTNSGAAVSYQTHCLNYVIGHLNSKFKSNYVLSKDICINESLTLWKGRRVFQQYIRTQAAKFGIKTFELCESSTGYLWSFVVYTGKQTSNDQSRLSKSTAVVLKLIEPLLNKGYRLFLDDCFNSPYLARFLKRNGTDCVGTLRPSRVDVPRLVTNAPLKQGQLVARHSGDICVLSWLDKKRINMISTCHGSATALARVSSRPHRRLEQFMPQSILDYNRSMGGVDLKDQMLEPYLLERKRCAKWYQKLFKRLLNVSINNSRILLESSLKAKQDNLKFRLELVHAILNRHRPLIPKNRRAASSHRRSAPFPHIVQHSHWPVRLPQTKVDLARNRLSRHKCIVCLKEGRKNQRTTYMCETCKVPLCVENCFKKYHTTV